MRLALLLPVMAVTICTISCRHKPEEPPIDYANSGYPDNIARIIVDKCATTCHNSISYPDAAGLRLDTWAGMFEGGNSGAVVVPYSTQYSSLLYYINTDSLLGLTAQPTMPANATPLTREEYLAIVDWITKGAPDRDGNVAFSSDAATRQKHYLTMQGCDKIAVIDGASKLVMRYIEVGTDASQSEQPHAVRFSKDGRYAFTCMQRGEWIQKIDAATDKVVQQVYIGPGQWNAVYPSNDGEMAFVTDVGFGKITIVDFSKGTFHEHTNFRQPHGISVTDDSFRTAYITSEGSNGLYKISLMKFGPGFFLKSKEVPLANGPMIYGTPSTLPAPHELLVSPDGTKLFATCQESNEIRVLDLRNDSLVKNLPSIIPVGQKPLEMAVSRKYPYLFVTCGGEPGLTIGEVTFKGAVYIINYNTHQVVGKLDGNFADPHGIVVDDRNSTVIVAHANNGKGPDGHHSSDCGGDYENGYYTIYDLNTLKPVSTKRYEVLPVPYGFDSRFK
jgi:DNA-binding beta-propeller fold protein YncE